MTTLVVKHLQFILSVDRDGAEKPQCFLCGKILPNSSMKPVKLEEHLNANYLGNISDSRDIFLQKKEDLK